MSAPEFDQANFGVEIAPHLAEMTASFLRAYRAAMSIPLVRAVADRLSFFGDDEE